MVQLIGRITRDAIVSEVKEGKKVLNFSIAINDYYKPKDGEPMKMVTYINCAYWNNPGKVAAEFAREAAKLGPGNRREAIRLGVATRPQIGDEIEFVHRGGVRAAHDLEAVIHREGAAVRIEDLEAGVVQVEDLARWLRHPIQQEVELLHRDGRTDGRGEAEHHVGAPAKG